MTWTLLLTLLCPPAHGLETLLLPVGSTWHYLDDGVDPGPTWTLPSFDDSGWSVGDAQLGYSDGDEVTEVGYGTDSTTCTSRPGFVPPSR